MGGTTGHRVYPGTEYRPGLLSPEVTRVERRWCRGFPFEAGFHYVQLAEGVNRPDPRSREGLRSLLGAHDTRAIRRLGQHFLVDRAILDNIADLVAAAAGKPVLEIGAGPGALTYTLADRGIQVVALEIDARLTRILEEGARASYPGLITVLQQDALRISWAEVARQAGWLEPITVVGNLPYYITGPLLAKLWQDPLGWTRAVLMVQQEVAVRVAAEPGTRASGAVSVLMRWIGHPRLADTVSREHFYPVPAVDSALLVIDRRPAPPAVPFEVLAWWVEAGFRHRRKMLRQALALASGPRWAKAQWDLHLRRCGIDGSRRAESLTMEEWLGLAASLPESAILGKLEYNKAKSREPEP